MRQTELHLTDKDRELIASYRAKGLRHGLAQARTKGSSVISAPPLVLYRSHVSPWTSAPVGPGLGG